MSLQPITVVAFDGGGLQKKNKDFLNPPTAFSRLENAYAWRQEVRKREGLRLLGRLKRILEGESLGNTPAGPPNTVTIADIFTTLGITGENPSIEPGSLVITVAAPDAATFTDQGDGTFAVTGAGVAAGSYVNYATGEVVLQFTALAGGAAITADINYFPGLPVMGIPQREISAINDEQTIWFDTKYAYIWNGTSFQEFIPGTTWNATDSDFFWSTNYRGVNPEDRLFFTTNFVNTAANPMRYTDGSTWTTFSPLVDATNSLFQARILIPYFGRLLALNVWEGAAVGTAVNVFNRCRFSQLGSPVAADAWRSDQFGRGGFIDAPTNEQIISATFLNNTLIVFFEKTTWQLRYVGEYGLPFIWERVASDFGSESTFSPILFNRNILAVGDRALIAADANLVDRIDLDIPDQVFYLQNQNEGVKRVHGIRNYQKEIVYWCYADSTTEASPGTALTFPNRVLLYNYRNSTYAVLRDNVTAFGTFQSSMDVTWDSTTIFWDDEDVTWDDFDTQSRFPLIVSGNQQGYVHYYQYSGPQGFGILPIDEQPSLYIEDVTFSSNLLSLVIPNHNLATGEIILVTGMMFADDIDNLPVATDLNDMIYRVTVTDPDIVVLARWDFATQGYYTNFSFTPDLSSNHYIGGGSLALLQNIFVQTKDFNPYQQAGSQMMLSYADFLMDVPDLPPTHTITGATQANPCVITSPSHGLYSGQQIMIAGIRGMTQLNTSQYYRVTVLTANTFSIDVDSSSYNAYTSGGSWRLLTAGMSIQLYLDASLSIFGNLSIGNKELKTTQTEPFYGPASQYAWYRFYARCSGQYIRFLLTFDDDLMNTLTTHQQNWRMNAINIWARQGGKIVF